MRDLAARVKDFIDAERQAAQFNWDVAHGKTPLPLSLTDAERAEFITIAHVQQCVVERLEKLLDEDNAQGGQLCKP